MFYSLLVIHGKWQLEAHWPSKVHVFMHAWFVCVQCFNPLHGYIPGLEFHSCSWAMPLFMSKLKRTSIRIYQNVCGNFSAPRQRPRQWRQCCLWPQCNSRPDVHSRVHADACSLEDIFIQCNYLIESCQSQSCNKTTRFVEQPCIAHKIHVHTCTYNCTLHNVVRSCFLINRSP